LAQEPWVRWGGPDPQGKEAIFGGGLSGPLKCMRITTLAFQAARKINSSGSGTAAAGDKTLADVTLNFSRCEKIRSLQCSLSPKFFYHIFVINTVTFIYFVFRTILALY